MRVVLQLLEMIKVKPSCFYISHSVWMYVGKYVIWRWRKSSKWETKIQNTKRMKVRLHNWWHWRVTFTKKKYPHNHSQINEFKRNLENGLLTFAKFLTSEYHFKLKNSFKFITLTNLLYYSIFICCQSWCHTF